MIKIFKSLAIITAVVAIAGGGTYALWTDSASITGATFSASTMDLRIDADPSGSVYKWEDNFAAPNPFAKVKPGTSGEQVIDIKNIGDVNGSATIQLVPTAWSALGDNLIFTIEYDGNHDKSFEHVTSGTLAQFSGNTYPLGEMSGASDGGEGKIASVKIKWEVPATAGNNIQGKSVTINTVFGLTQM